jgi:hypothetical protein
MIKILIASGLFYGGSLLIRALFFVERKTKTPTHRQAITA